MSIWYWIAIIIVVILLLVYMYFVPYGYVYGKDIGDGKTAFPVQYCLKMHDGNLYFAYDSIQEKTISILEIGKKTHIISRSTFGPLYYGYMSTKDDYKSAQKYIKKNPENEKRLVFASTKKLLENFTKNSKLLNASRSHFALSGAFNFWTSKHMVKYIETWGLTEGKEIFLKYVKSAPK